MRERGFFLICIVIAALFLLFDPSGGWAIHRFFAGTTPSSDLQDLEVQNASLAAKLASGGPSDGAETGIPAMIYVRYPFNFKQELLVAAGTRDGVTAGMQVVVRSVNASGTGGEALLGKVEQVFDSSALVLTLFDPRFQAGTRIGNGGTESLLAGGSEPKLTLIPKAAAVQTGDAVYAASDGFTYGLAIGAVDTLSLANGGLLQEAKLKLPYDPNALREVYIVK